MVAPSITRDRTPNFPSPPSNSNMSPLSMPLDLEANGRNFYTEFFFINYQTASPALSTITDNFGDNGIFREIPIFGDLLGDAIDSAQNASKELLEWLSNKAINNTYSPYSIRLPIPRTINDIITLNWQQQSITSILGGLNSSLAASINLGSLGLSIAGKTINPMLFLAFNHQNFREFTFEWVLAPRNKQESRAIKLIVDIFKNSSLPTKGFIMDYPLIAMVRMSPNDLNGHMKFKPMAIQAVAANFTPNPTGPSFFGEANKSDGAPTMVTLTVKLIEIKLWYRGEVK